jgi:hypothetical protein
MNALRGIASKARHHGQTGGWASVLLHALRVAPTLFMPDPIKVRLNTL